jgi:hypothetical protein
MPAETGAAVATPPGQQFEPLIDSREAAKFCGGCSTRHLSNLRKQGLPFIKLGERIFFRKSDLSSFIESRRVVQSATAGGK